MKIWTTKDIPSQARIRAVITGATGGIGYETALGLASAGAEVLVSGRNPDKGQVAIEQLRRAVPGANVHFESLDLASLDSIRNFAGRLDAENKPLNLLINNAGVMAPPKRRLTADGFEIQFGTNHLGHFALTGLLLPLLRKAPAPRVVTVSSLAHRGGKIDFDNLQAERRYDPFTAYSQSKLANLLFTFELQRRSDAHGWGLTAIAAHPGIARTDLIANGPGAGGMIGILSKLFGGFVTHAAADGALPTLFAATSAEAKPMGYYGPTRLREMRGPVGPAAVAPQAQDEIVARRLWEESESLTEVRFPVENS
jgi:NAD(P)-dependent dehydrogenase (short-subunit alcohol dehydrogenase family)